MPSLSMLRRTPRRRNSEFAKPADATVVTVAEDVFGGTGDVAVAEGLGNNGRGRFGGLGLGLTFNNTNSNESSRRNSIGGNGRESAQTTTNEKKKERRGSRRDLFLQDIRNRLTGKLPPTTNSSNNASSPSSGTSTPHQHQASPKAAPRGRAASQPPIPISQRRREFMSDREGGTRGGEQRGDQRGETTSRQGMGTIREAVSRNHFLPLIIHTYLLFILSPFFFFIQTSTDSYSYLIFSFLVVLHPSR
ncbi:hypothetical protein SMACR_05248 [Sordaria macrospora]|uniref:Uncharacterized protein n=1 Tax=Sordaria macrospora TaxID=5147 RepID=A0A8S8ZPI5_SORMA|nr:hypothetical protein SMACR_05248 [Sordaria macrospora]KAH7628710.1 hypothetical protein B0T09DRAFT_267504 [Sordaria sp. MPI-SDFR-AT-0083]WPJ57363.1 hypothetical protein SMAC4_05248 [Sordaria macrospora]